MDYTVAIERPYKKETNFDQDEKGIFKTRTTR